MPIPVVCPSCRKRFSVPSRRAGTDVGCPNCGTAMPVPAAPAAAPAAKHHDSAAHGAGHAVLMAPRPKMDVHDLIDMTAMVDIVFFLLIYFLVTSLCNSQASMPAPLPQPTVGKVGRDSTPRESFVGEALTVNIDQDDGIFFDNEPCAGLDELIVRLRQAREASGLERLRIAGSPEATHGKIVLVMDAGISAGMKDIQLAVQPDSGG